MKLILLSVTALLIFGSCCASEEMEFEFLERFETFIQEGDFSKEKLNTVWLFQDTPPKPFTETLDQFKRLKEQGIGKSDFHEVYSRILEDIAHPIEIEGKKYLASPPPYKMVRIDYSKKDALDDEIARTGWGYVLGEVEGRLYMIGFKRAE